MKALYRKYRPTKLADVVGQSEISSALEKSLASGKINHAYLFIGPRGTGKTSVARILAHAVNGFDYQLEDSYLDIIEIDAASNTGVDNIRELREKAIIAPTAGKYKVYIIDEVHMLSRSAANALLKTLEEPPAHVIFIMATTEAHKVPVTISSRTQTFYFSLARPEVMQSHLKKIAQLEQIPITEDALAVIAERGGGSFRDTLSLLDQIATLGDHEITAEIVNHALGLPSAQTVSAMLTAHAANDIPTQHNLLYQLLNSGLSAEIIASELINQILRNPKPELLPLLNRLTSVTQPFPEAKLLLALIGDVAATPVATPPSPAESTITQSMQPREPEKSTVKQSPAPEATENSTIRSSHTKETTATAQDREESTVIPSSEEKSMSTPAPQQDSESTITEQNEKKSTTTTEPAEESTATQQNPEKSTAAQSSQEKSTETSSKSITNSPFSWEKFLEIIRNGHEGPAKQLEKCDYELLDQTLHIYPKSSFTAKLLSRPENNQILTSTSQNFNPPISVELHSSAQKKSIDPKKDPRLSEISDIMGGVEELNSEIPF